MPSVYHSRRKRYWGACLGLVLCLWYVHPHEAWPLDAERFSIVGPQGWRLGPWVDATRVSVFETDAWRRSLEDGTLHPVPQLPLPRTSWTSLWGLLHHGRAQTGLMRDAHFTPAAYLEQIKRLRDTYSRQRDILMYYGGLPIHPDSEGLNFNAWSQNDLEQLRDLGCRPFIGLETMDPTAIRSLAERLQGAGYGPTHRIYLRIFAEPGYAFYGTEDGTRLGKRHTRAAYSAYRRRFAQTSEHINALNRQYGLDIHTVFAGASQEDFGRYNPPDYLFDALGYDLYVTPENKDATLRQLEVLSRRYPYKPLVIPEFGIATAGPAHLFFRPRTGWADPLWAEAALADVLEVLARHPAGVEEITVFSVNVSGRMRDRRWNWAWTPRMYAMLKEWKASPRKWRKTGFHHYDPLSYPIERDVLYLDRSDLRVVYRKLACVKTPGLPLFQETCFFLRDGKWTHRARIVYFTGRDKQEYHPPLFSRRNPLY